MTDSQKTAAVEVLCDSIIESVAIAGRAGAPGGSIYAALMTHGFSLEQYERIMDALVRIGQLKRSGQLYFTPANLQTRGSQ